SYCHTHSHTPARSRPLLCPSTALSCSICGVDLRPGTVLWVQPFPITATPPYRFRLRFDYGHLTLQGRPILLPNFICRYRAFSPLLVTAILGDRSRPLSIDSKALGYFSISSWFARILFLLNILVRLSTRRLGVFYPIQPPAQPIE